MTEQEKLKHCVGCRDNVYNNGCGGSSRCWMLDQMELVKRKRVAMNDRPPWNHPVETVPNCHRRSGYVYVKPEVTC